MIGYCRVSSTKQKDDLERQIENVKTYMYAKGYQFEIITDIGSGINYNKKGLNRLIDMVTDAKVEKVVILYKDRLVRFGYELLENMCSKFGTTIEIIDNTEKTEQQELVEDLVQIITVFSRRLQGKRANKAKKMIKTVKIMLLPNNKQETKLFQSAGTARFAFNWTLGREQESYEAGGKFISDSELRKEFTRLKASAGYAWLNGYSNNIPKQAIKDACIAYKNFFDGRAQFPRFKSRKKSRPSFYVDTCKIQFTDTHVKLEKITLSKKKNRQKLNWIRLAEKGRVPSGSKYYNPRVTFDGIHWFISVGLEYQESSEKPENKGIGIDLGIKALAVCSDVEQPYRNINKTTRIRKLKKKKCRLQRQVSRKYEKNRKGDSYCKTENIKKAEKKLLKQNHKLRGIRQNHLHQTTAEIINRKPKFIVMEDVNVKGMLKNRHLSEAIAEQCFYEFYRQIEYKSAWNNIKLIKADRFYPSSKKCSCCGAVKKDLKLKDRTYQCRECGFEADRDKNAAMNLYHYGKAAV